jgi:Tol biopolymer transport system component/tetratricopeptide (TPR) repeat protein
MSNSSSSQLPTSASGEQPPAPLKTGHDTTPFPVKRMNSGAPRGFLPRWTLWRAIGGCLVAFLCVFIVYVGIGGLAAYQGLQERAALNREEAEVHYQRGLEHVEKGEYELAIAEFELTLRLNPAHTQARDALRDTKTIVLAQPTPTSATLNEALNAILTEAETLVQQQKWTEAVERLHELRDLNANFETQRVSDLLFQANFKLGMQLIQQGQVENARQAFERALQERPNDPEASHQLDLTSLYLSAKASWGTNWPQTINYLEQLYTLVPAYLDVELLLYQAYESYGDALAAEEAWCQAEPQYMQAAMLRPGTAIQDKQTEAKRRCQTPTLAATARPHPTATIAAGSTAAAVATVRADSQPPTSVPGAIFLSRFNQEDQKWQIVAASPTGESSRTILNYGTQPAVSPDGRLLAYHSEMSDSEGLHVFDLSTGQDIRATRFAEDVTPDWAPDNVKFVFPSQRSGDRRWVVYIGWADAKSEAVALADGRTPAWSPDGTQIAYQGTDPQGNNPGLYLIGASGGPTTRLTDHESDRAPAWSPNGKRIAFMSSRSGRWQLYVVDVAGGAPQPLAQSGGNDGLPAWSPDGEHIAFVSDRDGSWGVYIVPAAGGQAVRVTDWGGNRKDWLVDRISWGR